MGLPETISSPGLKKNPQKTKQQQQQQQNTLKKIIIFFIKKSCPKQTYSFLKNSMNLPGTILSQSLNN